MVNYVVRTTIEYLCDKIGFKTKTKSLNFKCKFIFAAQFINSVIIIVLLGANLSFIPFFGKLFNGMYRDFTHPWYDIIGSVFIITMAILAVSPIIELIV